jgi:hypothetical protein
MIGIRITGMESINRRLALLQDKAAKKALRKGVQAGTKVLAKGAKRRVRKGKGGKGKLAGLLKKSIGSKVKTFRGNGVTVGIVGPRKGFLHVMSDGRRIDPVKYAHIEERGRQQVRIKKKRLLSDGSAVYGVKVARYAGNPFLQPTLEEDSSQTELHMGIATMKAINDEMKKA